MKSTLLLVAVSCLVVGLDSAAADWPQWRGSDRTGVSSEKGLLKSWPQGGPKRVWLYENAGLGYSAPAIVAGKFYTLGTREGSEILIVLDANTGKELWIAPLGKVHDDDRGDGPRGTPTIEGDHAYALTGPGSLVCVSLADRKVAWRAEMTALGGRVPRWGYSESVLVDGDQVVCTPGGAQGTLAAFDQRTGKLRWQSKEFAEPAHYSSIVPATLNGEKQYVQRTEKSVVGISPRDGALLWQTDFAGRTAVIPTPIVRGNEVYVTAGYGAGSKLIRIEPGNKATTVYENKVMKNHHGGVVLIGDHVYGHNDFAWIAQDFATGAEVWNHKGPGKGSLAAADGMLYCFDEREGNVVLIEASPQGWTERGRFKLDPQTKVRSARGGIWTHPVISNGKLYLRDQDLISCYDIKA